MAIKAQMYPAGLTDNGYLLDNALCFISQEQQSMHRVQPLEQTPAFSQNTIDAHRIEIDAYINAQNERLRMWLREQRSQQVESVMRRYESKVRFLISQKEGEIERASRRSAELREFLKRMEAEMHAWQRAARQSESVAASLSQRLREAATDDEDDAESWCCLGDDVRVRLACRRCRCRESCVIMLPCRHLCSCRDCDAFLDSCPVCNTLKKASIEAFF